MKAGVLLGKMLLHLISLYSYSHTNANKNPTNKLYTYDRVCWAI